MPRTSPTALRVLALVAGLLLVVGVVAAVATSGGKSKSKVSGSLAGVSATTIAPSGSSPTTVTEGTSPPTAGPGKTATTTARGATTSTTAAAPTTTVAPLTTVAGPVGDPGQPTETAAGAYTYAYSASGSQGAESGTITLTATDQSGGKQTQALTGGPQGTSSTEGVQWGSGMKIITESISLAGSSANCSFNPPIEELPPSLAVGTAWTINAACKTTYDGATVNVTVQGSASVTGKQQVVVSGQPVAVWVISDSYTITGSLGAFTFSDKHVATDDVSGRLGLLIQETATDTGSTGKGSGATTSHRAVQNLTPKP